MTPGWTPDDPPGDARAPVGLGRDTGLPRVAAPFPAPLPVAGAAVTSVSRLRRRRSRMRGHACHLAWRRQDPTCLQRIFIWRPLSLYVHRRCSVSGLRATVLLWALVDRRRRRRRGTVSSKRPKKTPRSASSKGSGGGSGRGGSGGAAARAPSAPGAGTGDTGEPHVPAAFLRPGTAGRVTMRAPRTPTPRPTSTRGPTSRPATDPRAEIFALPVDERQSRSRGCAPAVLEDLGMDGVAPTYSFDAPDTGGAYDLAVRFVGLRQDVDGEPTTRDRFERVERVEGLPANGEPAALTARVQRVNGGDWRVVAEPVDQTAAGTRLPRRVIEIRSQFAQLAQGPRVRPWSWPALVGLGAVVALAVQAWLASRIGIGVVSILALSLVGCLLGFVGGKLWYLSLHRKPLSQFLNAGACIQGFLLVSLAVLAGGAAILGLGVGDVLDVTAPGIFLGVAVGRPGCFLTGCCAGRPTGSAWGLVSSDRRVTVRRIPVQLLEAISGLVIGTAGLGVVLGSRPVPGAVFVASLAAYTLVRQLLFPLRVESRTSKGRMWTMGISGIVLLAAVTPYVA